ncbi:MAG: PstS family phosphate ABC transporter substrate-binding protein [Planctomycetaceae bacterium]
MTLRIESRRRQCSLLLALALAVVGCDQPSPGMPAKAPGGKAPGQAAVGIDLSGLSGTIKLDGSSTVFPVSEAVAEEFQNATRRQVHVTVGTRGTGSGFKSFGRGEIDICDASRPILKEEMEVVRSQNIEYIELPICFDALTVAVHPSNPLTSITVSQLKTMWEPAAQGKVTRWNQVNPAWPDAELTLFGAGADSGTFDYFTEAIVGKAKSSRGDFTASEDDNVLVQGIAGNKHALGFLPFSYYESNKEKLKALAVDWERGAGPIPPSLENVLQGKYNPLSRPLFIYVARGSADRPEVKAFVEYYLNNVASLAAEVKYLPLPEEAYTLGLDRFSKRITGTGFGGVPEVGLPVREILQRPPQQ